MHAIEQKEVIMADSLWKEKCSLNNIFSISEVQQVIMKCKKSKSVGIDQIPYEVLKNDQAIPVLTSLFQLCFDSGKILSLWKKALLAQ